MRIIFNPPTYEGVDILCRVYENQNEEYWRNERERDESEQIVAEVLFADHMPYEHRFASAWLPRGAANFIVGELVEFMNTDYKVAICNELKDEIGVLTSCFDNFEHAIRNEIRERLKGVRIIV